jgi:phage baseplate assembly protein gpV
VLQDIIFRVSRALLRPFISEVSAMLKVNDNKPIVFIATVKSTKDPKKLGRVQVELKDLDKPVEMPWIRLLQTHAGKTHGSVWLPEVGDMVAILRGAGDRTGNMFVLGSVYDGKYTPHVADKDGKNNFKQVKTRSGHLFIVSDEKNKELVSLKTGKKSLLMEFDDKNEKLTIKIKALKMIMDGKGKSILIDSNDVITIKAAKTVNILAPGTIVNIKAKECKVKADMNVKIEALAVEVKASTTVKITGSAKVEIKGGMVNIN